MQNITVAAALQVIDSQRWCAGEVCFLLVRIDLIWVNDMNEYEYEKCESHRDYVILKGAVKL